MIVLVTGPPGAGKSFYAVRKLGEALDAGKPIATNVTLAPDTPERVAASNTFRRLIPGRRKTITRRINRAIFVAHDVLELFRVRLHGSGEGRGVMVLDEAHVWLNARAWSGGDRERIVTFFTQHRKLGWDVYLIVQDAEMIDKQVRVLIEYEVHLRNLRRARLFGLVPFSPVNLFLAVWTWHAMRGSAVRRELFPLSWHKRLYSTGQIHGVVAGEGGDAVWLPRDDEPEAGAPGALRAVGAVADGVTAEAGASPAEPADAASSPGRAGSTVESAARVSSAERSARAA